MRTRALDASRGLPFSRTLTQQLAAASTPPLPDREDITHLTSVETDYANTDLDLRSPKAFDLLNAELSVACCTLHYTKAQDGTWWASYEADRLNDSATNDILAFIEVLNGLTDAAKQEFVDCTTRDFNIGIHCWDTWAYNLALPPQIVAAVATAGCSFSVTLYPMREPDGTPKIDEDDG